MKEKTIRFTIQIIFVHFIVTEIKEMSSNSKLATLLQYRFVKKPVEKIQNDDKSINEENSKKSIDDSQLTINGDATPSGTSTPTINGKHVDIYCIIVINLSIDNHAVMY